MKHLINDTEGKLLATFDGKLVVDEKGRTLLSIHSDGSVTVERYQDMSEKQKNLIASMNERLTSESIPDTLAFLNFEDEAFCS